MVTAWLGQYRLRHPPVNMGFPTVLSFLQVSGFAVLAGE